MTRAVRLAADRRPLLLALVLAPLGGALWLLGALQFDGPDSRAAVLVVYLVCPFATPALATALVAHARGSSAKAVAGLCLLTIVLTVLMAWLVIGLSFELAPDSDFARPSAESTEPVAGVFY